MGASAHLGLITGSSPRQAYDTACDAARYEYGSSYTGTIAESDGFIVGSARARWDAEQDGDRAMEDGTVSKWGPALLIPVLPVLNRRTAVVEVDITDIENQRQTANDSDSWGLSKRQRRRVYDTVHRIVKKGEGVVSADIAQGKTVTKPVITEGEGSLVREYRIIDRYGKVVGTCGTLAAAKEVAVGLAKPSRWTPAPFYTVEQITRRENGPLMTVGVAYSKCTLLVTVSIGTLDRSAPVKVWVTAGIYSC